MDRKNQFGATDFVIFGGMLLLSLAVGIYYAYTDRKKKSIENYYFGGRHMSPFPVAMSLAVTFISSVTVLGFPAHAYVYGTVIIWFPLAILVQITIACVYYIPLFHRLKLSSVYEYLELRYHRSIRLITSLFVIFFMVCYMGTTIYLTSIALSAVTPLSMALSIVLTAGICTLYTSMGGMKAVVWNDAFQSAIMVAGVLALTIKTTIMVGGLNKVWEAVGRGKRDTFWTFNPDPTMKHTIWTIMVGSGLLWTSLMCTNQTITQRYQSLKSVRDARCASIVASIPMVLLKVLSAITGCAMFAYFETCDPVSSGVLTKVDQTVAFLVVQVFEDAPGMAGLFVAAAYSGMLSTVSSGINSLSALIMEDFIVPQKPSMSGNKRLIISKILSVTFGILTTIIAFVTEYLGKTIVQVVFTLFGIFGGPILAIYSIGMHFPWINTAGAGAGLLGGVAFSMWTALGSIIYQPRNFEELPFSTAGCRNMSRISNVSYVSYSITTSALTTSVYRENGYQSDSSKYIIFSTNLAFRPPIADTLYSLSYMYVAVVGFLMAICVACTVSFLSGKNDPKKMDPKLFLPLVDNKIFPKSVRKFFQFGVAEFEPSLDDDDAIKKHPKIDKVNSMQHRNEQKKELYELYTSYDEKKRMYEGSDMNIAL